MADLKIKLWGLEFPNPVWTAAGPTAADADMLLRAARGGAGGLVAKTISTRPAKVPIPNIASPFAGSLLNAELWSELDYRQFIAEELPRSREAGLPVIASLGYSPEELAELGRALESAGCADAVEFSIHYVGKDAENLLKTARALKNSVSVPVLAKLSPAVQNLEELIPQLAEIVDGFVAINSLGPALDFDIESGQAYLGSAGGRGWLSGRAILPVGLHFVAAISQLTDKPVIGVGGIRSAEDIIKYLMAGASAVQVCSLAILRGQEVYGQLAEKLSRWMDAHGYSVTAELTGAFHRREQRPPHLLGEGPQLYPRIDYPKCTYCDLCVKSCVHHALRFEERTFVVDRKKCVSCGLCTTICPKNALQMEEAAN